MSICCPLPPENQSPLHPGQHLQDKKVIRDLERRTVRKESMNWNGMGWITAPRDTSKDMNCGQDLPCARILQRHNISMCKMKRRIGCSLFFRKGQVTVGDTQRVIYGSLNLSASKNDVPEIINIYLCL